MATKPGERRLQILRVLAEMLEDPKGERITTAALAAKLDVSEAAARRAQQARRRRLRLVFLGVSLTAVVMLALAIAAFLGRQEARRDHLEADL